MKSLCAALALVGVLTSAERAGGQDWKPADKITLPEAVDLAFKHNYELHRARLAARTADQTVRQAWSGVYPRVDARAGYTRTLGALNPFAGSEANDLISQGQAGMFLGSEQNPDFGLREAFRQFVESQAPAPGEVNDNPFFIENLFSAQVAITQVLYDGTVFDGVGAARVFEASQRSALRNAVRILTQQVAAGFYGALLAEARLKVLERSEARSASEVQEAEALVAAGLQPRTTRLSAEVQLNNTRTERLRAENEATTAIDQLRVLLGLPGLAPLDLDGALSDQRNDEGIPANVETALSEAVSRRPDLEALRLEVKRQDRLAAAIRAEYAPRFEAFFTLRTIGQVPDDRGGEDFFSNRFWGPDITGGLVLTWNLFNGFDTTSRLSIAHMAEARAQVDLDEQMANVRAEVRRELRDLTTASRQIDAQKDNVGRAELNYEETRARVQEGVTGRAELRNASRQLDESRLNLLQAIHDYRVASIDYRVAVGRPLAELEGAEVSAP